MIYITFYAIIIIVLSVAPTERTRIMRTEPNYRRRRGVAIILMAVVCGLIGYWVAQATLTPRYMDTGGTSYWTTFTGDKILVTVGCAILGGYTTYWRFQTGDYKLPQHNHPRILRRRQH